MKNMRDDSDYSRIRSVIGFEISLRYKSKRTSKSVSYKLSLLIMRLCCSSVKGCSRIVFFPNFRLTALGAKTMLNNATETWRARKTHDSVQS